MFGSPIGTVAFEESCVSKWSGKGKLLYRGIAKRFNVVFFLGPIGWEMESQFQQDVQ